MKQAVVAVISLNLIHTTVPQPADSSPRPHHARAGQPSPFPFGPSRIPNGVATKSATIEVKPELGAGSLELVNGHKPSPAKLRPHDRGAEAIVKPSHPVDTKMAVTRPLAFIENKGQFDKQVKFQVSGNGRTLWLTDGGIVFDFLRAKSNQASATLSETQHDIPSLNIPGIAKNSRIEKPAAQDMERHVICKTSLERTATLSSKPRVSNRKPTTTFQEATPQSGRRRCTDIPKSFIATCGKV